MNLAGQLPYFTRIGLAGLCGILIGIEGSTEQKRQEYGPILWFLSLRHL